MTAATVDRIQRHRGGQPLITRMCIAMAAVKILSGVMVANNITGYATSTSIEANPANYILGVSREVVDNSLGAAGDLSINIERGVFNFANSATTDAVTTADIGQPCYVADNITVARTWGTGALRPIAGRVVDVLADGTVDVAVGVDPPEGQDCKVLAAADLSSLQNTFVLLDSNGKAAAASAAGQDAYGVLLNAPTSGAIAIVRRIGRCLVTASASINVGVTLATTAAGLSKDAAEAYTNTSDAGGATDALIGSFVMGRALGAGTNGATHCIDLRPIGATPTTAA